MHYLATITFLVGALVFYVPAMRESFKRTGLHPAVTTWAGVIALLLVATVTPPGTLDAVWGAMTFAAAVLLLWGMHKSLHNDYSWKE